MSKRYVFSFLIERAWLDFEHVRYTCKDVYINYTYGRFHLFVTSYHPHFFYIFPSKLPSMWSNIWQVVVKRYAVAQRRELVKIYYNDDDNILTTFSVYLAMKLISD